MVVNNLKYSAQTIAPNPKEIDYWIDLTEDPNGGIIKYYNGSAWDYLNQMDDQNNLILEIKEIVDDLKNITIEKVNDLKYNLKVGDEVVGTIDIPEDKFLELVEYDEDSYILTFTFHTTEGQQIKQINLRNLLDNTDTTYTFEDGVDGSFTVTEDGGIPQKVSIGKPATAGTADVALEVEWDNVESKPSTFTPSAHNHTTADITDFPTLSTVATTGSYNDLTDKPNTTVADLDVITTVSTQYDPNQDYITVSMTKNNTITGVAASDITGSTIYAANADRMGYMTSAMFNKLNSVEDNANNYILPNATDTTIGGVRQSAAVADTIVDGSETVTTVATTLNSLLAALRSAGILAV